jgi:hypothetical protein
MARKADGFQFELEGKGLTPDTVDTLALLRLADIWFQLAVKMAEASQRRLEFHGLHVEEKCVAVRVTPSDYTVADQASERAQRVVSGREDPPYGTDMLARDMRRALRELPTEYTAGYRLKNKVHKLVVVPVPTADRPWERTELRVCPIRVGGMDPTALLASPSEPAPFTVKTSVECARVLGSVLQDEIDVVLDVVRDVDGQITDGRIVEVLPLEPGDAAPAWREWFAENASDWNDVENVLGELDRLH